MRPLYYILDGKLAVPVADHMAWARWFGTADRRVAETVIGPIVISTIFLGMDHSHGYGLPLLFETMIFRGGDGVECERCSSWEGAEALHAEAVKRVREEIIANNRCA